MLKINLARNKTIIILGLLSLSFVLLFIKLSLWQFSRSDEKKQIIEKISQSNNNLVAIENPVHISLAALSEYSVIKLQGYFDYSHSILLSNQYSNHQVGYHILTPFIINTTNKNNLARSNQVVLVDRGWLSIAEISKNLNPIPSNHSIIEISGLLRKSNENQYIMGDNVSKVSSKNMESYYQIQKINLTDDKLLELFPYPLGYHYIQLLSPAATGFDLKWQLVNITPEKHKAYAIQWLLLAISVVLLYSYLCYKTYKAKV